MRVLTPSAERACCIISYDSCSSSTFYPCIHAVDGLQQALTIYLDTGLGSGPRDSQGVEGVYTACVCGQQGFTILSTDEALTCHHQGHTGCHDVGAVTYPDDNNSTVTFSREQAKTSVVLQVRPSTTSSCHTVTRALRVLGSTARSDGALCLRGTAHVISRLDLTEDLPFTCSSKHMHDSTVSSCA